jgi:hypothetical protein
MSNMKSLDGAHVSGYWSQSRIVALAQSGMSLSCDAKLQGACFHSLRNVSVAHSGEKS